MPHPLLLPTVCDIAAEESWNNATKHATSWMSLDPAIDDDMAEVGVVKGVFGLGSRSEMDEGVRLMVSVARSFGIYRRWEGWELWWGGWMVDTCPKRIERGAVG